jgi:hypothetical protein
MTVTKSKNERKPKAYPKGLKVSVQDWAKNTLQNCENSYANRMDCATAFALMQLSDGDNVDFIAFRYKMDDMDALAIVTEAMKIDGMSLGAWSHIKFTNIQEFCQTLVKHGSKINVEVIALRVGNDERVYFEPLSLGQKLIWTQDPESTIADHRRWMADKVLNQWSAKINTEYTMRKAVPPMSVLLQFFDEWSQYVDRDTSHIRERFASLKNKDIKEMLGGYSFGLNRMILALYFDLDFNDAPDGWSCN